MTYVNINNQLGLEERLKNFNINIELQRYDSYSKIFETEVKIKNFFLKAHKIFY